MTPRRVLLLAGFVLFGMTRGTTVTGQEVEEGNRTVEIYSRPPTNIPITKVEVLGHQIFVRQPYRLPKRMVPAIDDITAKIFSPFLAKVDGSVHETIPVPEKPLRKRRQEPPYMPTMPKYPLPQCYTNEAGFMCCNKNLENLMHDTYNEIKAATPGFQNCNLQRLSNEIQTRAQNKFRTDFEVVGGIGDFASKTHFYSDYICKTEKEGRFFLAYATPGRHPKTAYRRFRQVIGIEPFSPPNGHDASHSVFI